MNTTKFCTTCQVSRPLEGGVMKKTGRINRWMCKLCVDKRSESHYGKPRGEQHALREQA